MDVMKDPAMDVEPTENKFGEASKKDVSDRSSKNGMKAEALSSLDVAAGYNKLHIGLFFSVSE